MTPSLQWYATTVKVQHERRVQAVLADRGIEAFLPMYSIRRRWSDRMKEVSLPLFGGYVFCRIGAEERWRVLDTPFVSGIVKFGGVPAAIPEGEIEAIRRIVESKLPLKPWPFLKPGGSVVVEDGPLRGMTGTLLSEKNGRKLVVGVEMLQRSVAVDLEPEAIVPLSLHERVAGASRCA